MRNDDSGRPSWRPTLTGRDSSALSEPGRPGRIAGGCDLAPRHHEAWRTVNAQIPKTREIYLRDLLFLGDKAGRISFFGESGKWFWWVWATVNSMKSAASASNFWRLAMAAAKTGASSGETRWLTLAPRARLGA